LLTALVWGKEGFGPEDLPRCVAVLLLPALVYAALGTETVSNTARGAWLARRATISGYRESPLVWRGFAGPVGLRVQVDLAIPAKLRGNLLPPRLAPRRPRGLRCAGLLRSTRRPNAGPARLPATRRPGAGAAGERRAGAPRLRSVPRVRATRDRGRAGLPGHHCYGPSAGAGGRGPWAQSGLVLRRTRRSGCRFEPATHSDATGPKRARRPRGHVGLPDRASHAGVARERGIHSLCGGRRSVAGQRLLVPTPALRTRRRHERASLRRPVARVNSSPQRCCPAKQLHPAPPSSPRARWATLAQADRTRPTRRSSPGAG
jgi:hypothetical protein